jgi:hypothetical protein
MKQFETALSMHMSLSMRIFLYFSVQYPKRNTSFWKKGLFPVSGEKVGS